ncbi:MAG: Na-translocating system protein MpsB, partial [Nitrospirota bacterium]
MTTAAPYIDTQRMHLRGLVLIAGEIVATYWPMPTFVHHNPLHGLEDLHFEEAVRRAEELLGGRGYLPNDVYRGYLRSGRIRPEHMDAALAPVVRDDSVAVAGRPVTHAEVLRAHLLHGITSPSDDTLEAQVNRRADRSLLLALVDHCGTGVQCPLPLPVAPTSPIEQSTLAAWCDRTLGTHLTEVINRELIRWCEAFLDEDHASWTMPGREQGFYRAWKALAGREWSPCGISGSRKKLAALPERADDALLESLERLAISKEAWPDYLSRHLTALAGWAGFIKWRSGNGDYPWQKAHPIDLLQYLAVRLWYERELVDAACRESLGVDGNLGALTADMAAQPHRYLLLERRGAGHLPAAYASEIDRIHYTGRDAATRYRRLVDRYAAEFGPGRERAVRLAAAWRLVALAGALQVSPERLLETAPMELGRLVDWLDAFPETDHGPVWLRAFEATYRERLLQTVKANYDSLPDRAPRESWSRHQAQAAFCIDVRSEPFRRHLEAVGDYETFGIAGFFTVFIRYLGLGCHHETDQFPVIVKAKNTVREVIRTYHSRLFTRHATGSEVLHTGHELWHALKENVVTPYVTVETLGWFYGLPFVGKTIFTAWYQALAARLKRIFVPAVATTVTVDKLTPDEVEEMLAAEQRAIVRRAFQKEFGVRHLDLSLDRLEYLRKKALFEPLEGQRPPKGSLTADEEAAFIELLRTRYGIDQGGTFARMERITRIGFTTREQIFTVETALR